MVSTISSTSLTSNQSYTFASPRPQQFPFPSDMILKITQKPESSGKGFFKLLQTCKWFNSKNFIFPIGHLYYLEDGKDWEASYPLDPSHKRTESFNFDCNASIKIWVIDALTIRPNNKPNLTLSLMPKLYRCDAGLIDIWNQTISFDDLKYFMDLPLVNGLRQFRIEKVEISPMVEEASTLLEIFLQNLSNVLSFQYTFDAINSNYQYFTLQRSKAPKVKKYPQDFIEYKINAIPNNFDIEFFINFIKINPDINLTLNFCTNISDKYKERLENFIEDILKEYNNHKFYPPTIKFQDQNVKKVCELMHFRKSYATSRQTFEFKNEFAERVQFLRRR